MSKNFILFFSIFIYFNVYSQNITIKKGEIIKDRQFLMDKNEITTNDDQGNFVSIRPHRDNGALHNYFVELYRDLNFINRIEIETQNKSEILDVFILNKKVHVFIKEEFDKTISLRCDIIDIDTKTKTQKILYKIDKDSSPGFFKALKNDNNISLEYSSQIILTIPVVKDKMKYAFVKIFSNDLEILSQHSVYPEKTLSYRNIKFLKTLQYNHKIYLLFNVVNNKKDKTYKIIELNDSKEKVLEISIEENTYELIDSKIKDNQLIISGLYSKQKKGGFKGFTYYSIDLGSLTVSSQKQNPFLNKKASAFFNGFFKKNRSIDIKNVFIDEQQNTYVVGQFYVIQKQQVPIGIPIATIGSAVLITYNPINIKYKLYDDLLIGKINTNGELEWDKVLELRQTEKITSRSNKRDSSIFTFLSNNQLNIFLNGYINMKKEKLEVKQDKRLSKTNFYNITFNPEGTITPKIILSNKDSKIIFRAGKTVKSNNQLYILGQGNMRKQLLNLKL